MALKYELNAKNIANRLLMAHNYKQSKIRGKFFEAEYEFFREHIKNKKVLVAGSGLGDDSFELAKYNKEIVGIELLPYLVDISKKNLVKKKFKNIIFKKGDINNLSYRDKEFDVAVLNMGTIGNFEDKKKVLKELLRVAKIVYFDFYPPSKENLEIRKKLYAEELWKNVRIDGKTLVSDDGLESISLSFKEINSIVNKINAKIKYYPLISFAVMAEIRKP